VSLPRKEAENKICPILTLAYRQIAYCQTTKCMLWSEMANPEYGLCEIKEFFKGLERLSRNIPKEWKK